VPFAALVSFEAGNRFTLDGPMQRSELEQALLDRIDDPTGSWAIRLDGEFAPVTFRSIARQTPPYRPLADVIATDEKLFHTPGLSGTMVGFYFPDMAAEMNQPGFHLHMVTDDRSTGGHVYDFTLQHAEVLVGRSHTVHVELPERNLAEVLTLDDTLRSVHLHLVRSGSTTAAATAQAVGVDHAAAADALRRLGNRGMADADGSDPATALWRPHLARSRQSVLPPALDDL
jgi:acetolactate decarboxylase